MHFFKKKHLMKIVIIIAGTAMAGELLCAVLVVVAVLPVSPVGDIGHHLQLGESLHT